MMVLMAMMAKTHNTQCKPLAARKNTHTAMPTGSRCNTTANAVENAQPEPVSANDSTTPSDMACNDSAKNARTSAAAWEIGRASCRERGYSAEGGREEE